MQNSSQRIWKLLTSLKSKLHYKRHLNAENINVLRHVIIDSEKGHRGEIRLVVEHHLSLAQIFRNMTARERAIEWFSELHMWDTEGNTGILLYLLLNEKKIEIVADRGISSKVPQEKWDQICRSLQNELAAEHVVEGISATLRQFGVLLCEHFPPVSHEENPDELSNTPIIVL